MRVTIRAVGRDRRSPTQVLFDLYCERCPWRIELVEVSPDRSTDPNRRKALEALRLLKGLPADAVVVALDETGEDLTSEGFAARLRVLRDAGHQELACLIGGPDGLDPSVRVRAQLSLAFGRMTWPHQLVRVMLAEQLYRASTILAGHPYHRA
jgi:23S rRNA (pseudouridine1915-N3)-methyltransferase